MRAPRGRHYQRGQGLVEYTVLLVCAVLVLVANPNIILELVQAIGDAYVAFVDAISLSWFEIPI
ncbi:hypothetical protein N799_02235 [Lysobacter arseniciresistens ZS79]|uniref:Pilin n=1 Tax=Lysobacter arseniciresistens ZS79 TaxID=913325 RepID=A0A0A0F1Q7_9GAMM|nr:hypothetical protein [Lysobacter arseniciresistens]KGM56729.1 hypothetical protein N799_02235 [Lysobacter arseniciresistens ZS79]